MRQDKDRAGHWLIEHFGELVLHLIGVRNIVGCRALKGDLVAPRRFPDGLLEVTFTDRPGTSLYLIEIETDASADADRQMAENLMALALDHRPIPKAVVLVLRPKGKARVLGRYELTSDDGATTLGGKWDVVELWTLKAADLLAANDVGLLPWIPLTEHEGSGEDVLKECLTRLERDAPADRYEGLLAVSKMLASALYDERVLDRLFAGGRKMINLMDFPLIQRLVEEEKAKGRQEGEAKGRHAAQMEATIGILVERFQSVPDDLRTRLAAVADEARLTALLLTAATCSDLEAFRIALAAD
jgi:predicted transposase YdaD